ncbi:MAG: hypothetical protein J5666_06615 [Bacilli bacterium]|nr:hypothetical protein [Bacilli bacterium]
MKYQYAKEGVKHLYHASICEMVLLGLSFLFSIIDLASGNAELGFFAVIMGLVVIVLAIAILVLEIIGTHKGSKDDKWFLYAFYCLIGVLILTVIKAFIDNSIVTAIFELVTGIGTLLVTFFIIKGLISLFTNLGNQKMVDKSKRFLIIFFALFIASIVVGFVNGLMTSESLKVVRDILELIVTVASIAAEILLLLLYKDSTEELAKAKEEPISLDEPLEEEDEFELKEVEEVEEPAEEDTSSDNQE